MPAAQPPPPPKAISNEQKLQDIINSITNKTATPNEKPSGSNTPAQYTTVESISGGVERKPRQEKWRSYDEEKLKKLYENTVRFSSSLGIS